MSGHSREPWKIVEDTVVDCDGNPVCDSYVFTACSDDPTGMLQEDMERIVACVNACRHLPSEYLAWLESEQRFLVGTSIRELAASVARFEELVGADRIKEVASISNKVVQDLVRDFGGEADAKP